ncbi:MAG: DegT/DnrJ/EryC1/StrS family aminotransferase, partial [Paramuribaculum sp.]|nr:DegT/DnrJ/EryC1/StrS family aminotransferase [Paramuribaculum sp.]
AHAVGVASGLDALRLVMMAYVEMGLMHKGDEVLVPANTYVASFLAISQAGLMPVPVDPDPVTMNITGKAVSRAMSSRVKAVMPVHLYGRVAWDGEMVRIARNEGLLMIEDCAQALGARSTVEGLYGSFNAGGLGNAAGISFYPTKNLGALGDGGMVVTNDKQLADMVRSLANYGSSRRYHNEYMGINSRLDPIQAAMLDVKFKYLDEVNAKRMDIARMYDSVIDNPYVIKPVMPKPGSMECVWHQYVVRVPKLRNEILSFLKTHGVDTDIHYPCPPHMQPCYEGLKHEALPVAELLAEEVLSLPIGQYMSLDLANEIADIINRFGQ